VQQVPGETNARGQQKKDLFAEREDGAVNARLTSSPLFQTIGGWQICPDESASSATISGAGRRFLSDGTAEPGSGGIYKATMLFDADGNVTGLASEPAFVANIGYRAAGDELPDIYAPPAWSPDMSKIAFDLYPEGGNSEIRLYDVATGRITTLVQEAVDNEVRYPAWTPDGTYVVFKVRVDGSVYEYIDKITLGGARSVVVKSARYAILGWPFPSPDSASLIYDSSSTDLRTNVFRVSISGGKSTNLTGNLPTSNWGVGWR
jgi:hypothetical protein